MWKRRAFHYPFWIVAGFGSRPRPSMIAAQTGVDLAAWSADHSLAFAGRSRAELHA
jgi:hypothetical protein